MRLDLKESRVAVSLVLNKSERAIRDRNERGFEIRNEWLLF